MRYGPNEDFAAPARHSAELWRTVLGFFLASAAQIGLIFVIYGAGRMVLGSDRADTLYNAVFFSTLTATETLLLLLSAGLITVGLVAVVDQLHRRSPLSLVGPLPQAWRDFWAVLKMLAGLYLILSLIPSGVALDPNMAFDRWLLLLPVAIPVLFIQISSEELFFRGYLQQQLAARYRSPLIWIGIPSVIFAFGHYSTDLAGDNAIFTAIWAGLFGIAAADLTARSGNLGAALALHFANNFGAILLASLPGAASGLALYVYPITLDDPAILPLFAVDLDVMLVSWLAARVALRV
ncbi:abortive infection protein [Actibacterium atlanticum]|uniref:Abortive infection protein n=1 Tax=Actibacterium atlanticum TaxID=1461693 RepID=A0A058ZM14_9RHOB|nr:CPBP family intramembrane glutamic endopeptidase [Actibacterium atlanticum]KCV82240.1 abortive infection protein [Actibacterium atlanticum]